MTAKSKAYAEELITELESHFKRIPEHRGPQMVIPLKDAMMSAYAMFSLKFPSLLEFEEERKESGAKESNLKSIFGIGQIPSDTQMRSIVDEVEPQRLKEIFPAILKWIQSRKLLKPYEFFNHKGSDYYLTSVDGTGFFSSNEINCDACLTRKSSKNEKITYHHQMLTSAVIHPNLKTVIPLAPEAIIRQDGASKNDCEMNALKRWVQHFREQHPQLKIILNLDGLYGNNKIISLLRGAQIPFIIVVSDTLQNGLFEYVDGAEQRGNVTRFEWEEKFGDKVEKTKKSRFRFKPDCPLNGQEDTEWVNFFEYWEEITWIDSKGKPQQESYHCTWVTELNCKTENQAKRLVEGARSRWKVENEAHNTLKNQGYNLEHSYGHGESHLSENFILLMLLSFLVDQIQLMGCRYFLRLIELVKRKTRVWERIRNMYCMFQLKTWTQLLIAIIQAYDGGNALDSS
jgi:hypothetical protein